MLAEKQACTLLHGAYGAAADRLFDEPAGMADGSSSASERRTSGKGNKSEPIRRTLRAVSALPSIQVGHPQVGHVQQKSTKMLTSA